ncbi:acyl-CoA dehydrogenase family protein [Nocardioides guangzhouensis]|uniref:Medium-chain specific acyl-CoA dehydrogenase, mitochondrial n=1 Tax=Nocardioides guangzhouensis TaxID=2497878 RepID=A0A4Q4ZIJ6_9ACTN|nr:acyl-CoA dehydrogenase family protein [Nocardioides guangzhouensis]RYP88060.1 acyl-CoA dehydrogenase family protein [Nocardioides guangzhouensis]
MYGLTPEDLDLQARARGFTDELIGFELEAETHDGALPAELTKAHHERAVELGLTATNMPASVGGRGCTTLQQVLVQEQVGRVTNGIAWCCSTPPSWWPEVANDLQRERWLLPTVRGEMEECYAITEEGAGSDVADLTATARREGDDYVLDGVKWHVTSFNEADYVFFQAVLTTGPHAGDQALFVVDKDAPGVRVVRTPAYTHTLGHAHPIVAFEGVRVPATHLVGSEADGMSFVYEWFRFERLMVASRCLGAAERLVDETTAFARDRIVGGQPLIERQLVQGMLADSLTELFAARSMVYETARSVDEGVDTKVLHARCSMVKLYASEMAGRVADRAVQVFGGRGYMRENVAERFFRELRVERIWEGASEVQRVIVADQLAKRGRAALV